MLAAGLLGGSVAAASCGDSSHECSGTACQDAPTGVIADDAAAMADAGQTPEEADVSPVAGFEHFVDGWKLASWAPGCGLYEPATPAGWASIPPITWVPCLSARPGCQQVQLTKAYAGKSPLSTLHSVSVVAGRVVFGLGRGYAADYDEELLWDSSSGIVGAWRTNGAASSLCAGAIDNLQGGVASFSIPLLKDPSSNVDTVQSWHQIVGSPGSMMGRGNADYTMDGNAIGQQAGLQAALYTPITTSNSLMTFYYPQGNLLFVRDRAAPSSFVRVEQADGGVLRLGEPTWLVGDTVIFDAYTSPATIGAWSTSAKYRTIVTPAPGAQSHSASTDGTWVVWEDSYDADFKGGQYTAATLYVAPFPKGTDPLVPTSLGSVPCTSVYCDVTVSDGYVFAGDGLGNATIVQISDNSRWQFSPMPSAATKDRFGGHGIMWNGELWIASELSGIERIQLSALPKN